MILLYLDSKIKSINIFMLLALSSQKSARPQSNQTAKPFRVQWSRLIRSYESSFGDILSNDIYEKPKCMHPFTALDYLKISITDKGNMHKRSNTIKDMHINRMHKT